MITCVWLFGVSDVESALETLKPRVQCPTQSNNSSEECYVLTNQRETVCSWLQLWKNLARIVLQPE